jgi:predicted glycosyltransferase
MTETRRAPRILIYSHDSFGLGHLRRCRTIAHALVETHKDFQVLILSGSPIIGNFDFRSRVDFIRLPGVIKLRNGEYTALNLHIDIDQVLEMRASIMRHTAEIFDPDLFIVDKEPLGLRGDVRDTLASLRERGVPSVLGLRDVMDEPSLLAPEWERKNAVAALRDLYDEIWVYGLPQICEPLEGIELPKSVRRKIFYTGYLRRTLPKLHVPPMLLQKITEPYILVTTGGGGDGETVIDLVLQAYENDDRIPHPALLVLGPFMQSERQAEFLTRAARLKTVEAITFDAQLEHLMARSVGVVAMGGYNTFCEILSFDKPTLIVPRTQPRQEQLIRARRAAELGILEMLMPAEAADPGRMAEMLIALPDRAPPSRAVPALMLDGLDRIAWQVADILDRRSHARLTLVEGTN